MEKENWKYIIIKIVERKKVEGVKENLREKRRRERILFQQFNA